MRIKSNVNLKKLYQIKEVGFLPSLMEEIDKNRELQQFDFYIYFKRTNENWVERINIDSKKTILFIVVDESARIPSQFSSIFFAVFKVYLTDNNNIKNVFHLPVGYSLAKTNSEVKSIEKRKTNVFFSGNLHVGRKELYKHFVKIRLVPFSILHRLRDFLGNNFSHLYQNSFIKFTRKFADGLSESDYLKLLYDSKIVLCPQGNPGQETLRHYEALRAGCIIISDVLPNTHCFKNSPIIVLDEWASLDKVIYKYLANPFLLKQKQDEICKWWNSKCSEKATVDYIVNKVKSLSKNEK